MNESRPYQILTINIGSTSTKLAYFRDDVEILRHEVSITPQQVAQGTNVMDQMPFRLQSVQDFLQTAEIDLAALDLIVTRGGTVYGLHSGAYQVDEHVVAVHRYAPRSQMPSGLAAIIGYELAKPYHIPVIFYDAPSADDAEEIMHYTGIPEIRRFVTSHCLNGRYAAQKLAAQMGKPYQACNFVVAHLGGGITVAFHREGRIVDSVLDDAGPMSPQRAGRIPLTGMIQLCYSGQYDQLEMMRKVRGQSGLAAYLGSQDLRAVEEMMDQGNALAKDLFWYMAYQIAKSIGEMAVVNSGKLDGIILTGGMAHSKRLTELITKRVSFLAPVTVLPGEQEMQALAEGGLRVLRGAEPVYTYRWLPEGYTCLKDFIADHADGQGEKG